MPHLVCLATWPVGADALRVRFKFSSIAFSQGTAAQSRSIQFLLHTFQLHENSEARFRSKVATHFAEVRLQTQSIADQQPGRIQFPAAAYARILERKTPAR